MLKDYRAYHIERIRNPDAAREFLCTAAKDAADNADPDHFTRAANDTAIAVPTGSYHKASKAHEVIGMLMAGASYRQIRAATGVSVATIAKYRGSLIAQGVSLDCPCGQDAGHRGWCSVRFAASPARQAVVARLPHKTRTPF